MRTKGRLSMLSGMLSVVMVLSGCGSSTSKSVEYATNLEEAVNEYEESRSEAQQAVSEKTNEVVKKLSSAGTPDDLVEASEAWEETWSDIDARFKEVSSDFEAVRESAEGYFKELDRLASEIKNPLLKESELEKTRSLKLRWNQAYQEAAASIGKMRNVQADASDFQKIIVLAATRAKIERNIEEIREIASRANTIFSDLAKLTAEGRKLVKS